MGWHGPYLQGVHSLVMGQIACTQGLRPESKNMQGDLSRAHSLTPTIEHSREGKTMETENRSLFAGSSGH